MRVLVTCPPMIAAKKQFLPIFNQKNWTAIIPEFIQVMDEDDLIRILPDCDGWIIGDDPATERVFQAGKTGKLKGVVKWGVGIDNVDLGACKRLGIPVANTPNMFGSEVADVAIGYVIGLARHLFEVNEKVKKGTWHKPQGISLKGKNVGVVGYGDIGKSVCDRLAAFGLNISVWDPGVADNAVGGETILRTWPDGIEICDFVILTCALTRHNVHMLDTRTLNMCKDGVRIINVARGPLIDERALTKALKSGRVGGAALDVFEVEPVAKKNPLLSMPNVIVGSHNGSNSKDAVARANSTAISILQAFLNA